jgi:two-component system nitrate/nitrite response regulator NarL
VIRVVIVAASRLYRDGLAGLLAGEPNIDVVATAPDAETGVVRSREARADVVLFELAMARSTEAVRGLTETVPGIRVVALTVPETEQTVIACAEAGVVGFVTREGTIEDVVAAIKSAARGDAICPPRMAAILLGRVRAVAPAPRSVDAERMLTSREQQIVVLIEQGLSNKQIAGRLFIEVTTVKNHVHNILEKLQVQRRGEAAAYMRADRISLNLPD